MGIDLDLRRLRFFVEVVRQGGFSQAAKVVFAAQPTVSKAVKQLEDELGVGLLDRGSRRSTPTAAGTMVYRRALALLTASEDLSSELEELRGLKRGTLRLGFPRVGAKEPVEHDIVGEGVGQVGGDTGQVVRPGDHRGLGVAPQGVDVHQIRSETLIAARQPARTTPEKTA